MAEPKDRPTTAMPGNYDSLMEQVAALANVLFGKVSPAGHLSFTCYQDDSQLPAVSNYNLTPNETGGLGRTYQYVTGTPTYPFGYGLSYILFKYGKMNVTTRKTNAMRPSRFRSPSRTPAPPPGPRGSRTPCRRKVPLPLGHGRKLPGGTPVITFSPSATEGNPSAIATVPVGLLACFDDQPAGFRCSGTRVPRDRPYVPELPVMRKDLRGVR